MDKGVSRGGMNMYDLISNALSLQIGGEAKTVSTVVTQNHTTYYPTDGYDGFSSVYTNITPNLYRLPVITENGTYLIPPDFDGLDDITVDVPKEATLITPPTIVENGTYNASDYNADGFKSVTVNVPSGGMSDVLITSEGFDQILASEEVASYSEGDYTWSWRICNVGGVKMDISYDSQGNLSAYRINIPGYIVYIKNGTAICAQYESHFPYESIYYNGDGWYTNKNYNITSVRMTSKSTIAQFEYEVYKDGVLLGKQNSQMYNGYESVWNLNDPIYTNSSLLELKDAYLEFAALN